MSFYFGFHSIRSLNVTYLTFLLQVHLYENRDQHSNERMNWILVWIFFLNFFDKNIKKNTLGST